jgi:3-dehydroquinate synthetase
MNLYNQIIEKSREIDWTDRNISDPITIVFPVPETHVRHQTISRYFLNVSQVSNYHFLDDCLILCDENIKEYLTDTIKNVPNIIFLEAKESLLKTITEANFFIKQHSEKRYKKVIAIGGGIVINFGGYVAEKLQIDVVYVPTTVISMSDASIGGKVRLNDVQGDVYTKHAHKTFYEPSQIVLDPQFLNFLSSEHIRVGIAEIIKHALYQSPLLTNYILSYNFNPSQNRESLLRAILWTADLKRVCLEVDPEESMEGSYKILRAAHDISDRIEERKKFTISHGEAVEEAMVEDLRSNKEKFELLIRIYKKLEIPYSI